LKIAYALTIAALAVGSAAGVIAAQDPATAQVAVGQEPQNSPAKIPSVPAMSNGTPFSFADLAATLQPAVVNISTKQRIAVANSQGAPQSLQDLFRQFQDPNAGQGQGDDGQPVTREATSLGSGFIISPDGYVVTANHVISGHSGKNKDVETITVTLADKREYVARVIGRDQVDDLALLKVDARSLPFVRFGDSTRTRVGDWALAIGNPFGLGGTVTAGIVSALHRNIQSNQAYDRYIQTDASINQGNSGGPLFDIHGNVIGINTIILSPSGGNIGLGFAIPAEIAKPAIDQLQMGGKVRRGYLGVAIQPMTDDIAASLGIAKNRGEILADVTAGGPGARAGLRRGDVIVRVAGVDVTADNSLSFTVANQKIGSTIPIDVIRAGQRLTVRATLAERPSEASLAAITGRGSGDTDDSDATQKNQPGQQAARASLGITLQPLTAETRQQLRIPDTVSGVLVAGINPNSDAAQKDIRRGDVILSINQVLTPTPAAAAAAVEAARRAGRPSVLMLVQRGTNPPSFIGVQLMPPTSGK